VSGRPSIGGGLGAATPLAQMRSALLGLSTRIAEAPDEAAVCRAVECGGGWGRE